MPGESAPPPVALMWGEPVRGDLERWSALVSSVAQDRNRDAFSRLFKHFAPRLKAYFMRLRASEASADELVQETMLTLWQRADTYRPERAAVSTWLYTIARNLCIDRQRRERHFEPSEEFDASVADEGATTDITAERDEAHARLARAVRMLSPEQAEVLEMFYFQWRTTREIAAVTGLPEGTVKSRMRLAVNRLRTLMEDA